MPIWTLRLIAAAGFVALLSRLPALDSVADALVLAAAACAVALAAHGLPRLLRGLRQRLASVLPHPGFSPRYRSAHGADA
jgi:hypothetical protein